MRSALLAIALLLAGCQTSGNPTGAQKTQNLEFQQYAEAIGRGCILRSSMGHMTGPETMKEIAVQSIQDGTVNGQKGWKSIYYLSNGSYRNFYHDTNEGYYYCDGTFIDKGFKFQPD